MSQAERSFFKALEEVVDGHWYIFSKVRLEDIIQVKKGIGKKKTFGLRGRIKSRHIDFILCDKETSEILMCIELDDRSHNRKDRIERDQFVDKILNISELPITRIKVLGSYSIDSLKAQLFEQSETDASE